MVEIGKNVQKRMIRAILVNGGSATTIEVCNLADLRRSQVHTAKTMLLQRRLIKKQQRRKGLIGRERGLYDENIYTLNEKYLWKINKMIDELEQYERENQ